MPISVEDHKKAEVHNALGVIYRKKGKYDRAIEEYEKALHFDPEYTLAYSNLGFIYYRKSMYDKAMEYYKKAIEIDPSYVLAYNKLGVVYRKKGLYKKALEVYKKAIEISPDYAEIYYNMAVVYRYMKKYSEASEMYKKVIEFRPEYIPAHVNLGLDYKYSGEYDKAIEEYEKVLKLDPNYVEIFINFGIAYFLKKEYDKAIEQLSLSIEKDKNNPLSYYYLGMTYEATGDFEKALDAYNKTYEVEPNFPNLNDKTMDVHLKIGDRLLSEKKYKEAKEEYKLAWECKNDPPIYLKIARIDELSESWEEAVNSYQRLEKINPEGPKYKEKIKELLLHAGDNAILANQYTKAIEYYKRILMDFPDELDIRYRLGEAFLAIEKNDDAFQEFNYIFKKDPDFPDIKTKVDELSFSGIFILIKNKQFDEAIVRCKDMLARYPDNLEALYGLGTIYAGKDMTNEAIEIFEKIADRDMKFKNVKLKLVQLYTNRAEAYFEKIHYQEAFDQYKKIIQIDPENIECLYKVAVLYDRRKKSDEAIEYYEKVYQKVKNYKDVSEKLKAIYLWKSNIYYSQKKLDDAIHLYKKIIEIDPQKTALIYFKIATIYEKREMLFEAAENYEKARTNDNSLPGLQEKILALYLQIADGFFNQKRYMEAITHYEKVIAITPNRPEIYYAIGKCYFERHIPIKAIEYFEKTIALKGEFPDLEKQYKEVLEELGEKYLKEHIFEKASKFFSRLIELYPKEPKFIFKLGFIFENILEYDKAIEQYQKVKSIDSNYLGLLINLERTYMSKANDLFDKGKYEEACAQYKNALDISPQSLEAIYQSGVIMEKTGKITEAYKFYEKVYKLDKDFKDINEIMGRLIYTNINKFIEEKKYPEAIKECTNLLQADPKNPRLHFIMASVYLSMNDKDKARIEYGQVLQINPEFPEINDKLEQLYLSYAAEFMENKKFSEAKDYFEKIIALHPDSIIVNYNLASIYENEGNIEKAAGFYDKVMELDKNYQNISEKICNIYVTAGGKFFDKKDFNNASLYLEKAVKNGFENEDILYKLGSAYENTGMLDKAKKYYDKIIKKEGVTYKDVSEKLDDLDFHKLENNLEEEKYGEAIREAKKILEKNPNNIEIQYNLALSFEKKKFYNEAVQYFDDILKKQSDYLDVKERMKKIYIEKADKIFEMGSYSDALRDYLESIKFDNSNNDDINFKIAICYFNMGEYDKAMEIIRRFVLKDSNNKLNHNLLGQIYTQKNMLDEAVSEFQKAISIDKNFAEAYNNLGMVYIKKGMYQDAMKEFKTAVKIDPSIEIKFNG